MINYGPSLAFGRLSLLLVIVQSCVFVSAQDKARPPEPPTQEVLQPLIESRDSLRAAIAMLRNKPELETRDGAAWLADVGVFEKAATWMLRFQEFPKADYVDQLRSVLEKGALRAEQLNGGKADWSLQPGITIRGYVSGVDGSVQPYALTLPVGVNPRDGRRWPLHVVLHGRADQMNEVNFIHRMDGKPLKTEAGQAEQNWIQLDVYGRGNNAYRYAGETDVFEAMNDVKRRFRIDEDRITLHGFSMGGAGAWHLGLHHPDVWSSVGPGAGFVDFYRYQKKDPENPEHRLPEPQDKTLTIYDSINYAMNAFNVPVCTYGGENDPQLLASTSMAEAADAVDVPIKVIIGPRMGHAFDPESQKQFMAFHLEQSEKGRPRFGQRKEIRLVTHTLRYNKCDWLAIEEVETVYEPSTVEARVNDAGEVEVTTSNVAALRLMRDVATDAVIDGTVLECRAAADGLLPDVFYVKGAAGWQVLDYDESRGFGDNPEVRKRPGLQGPIDDAFMSSFVCVRGTGTPWNENIGAWSQWTLARLAQEFAQWMRGDVRIVDDVSLDDEMISSQHLVLFGDPSSNAVLSKIVDRLPIQWTKDTIRVGDQEWSAKDHAVSLIFPNPLNPAKYVVLNSGHTFHEKDFRSSNAWLFPRLGDIAVQKIAPNQSSGFTEQTVHADLFDAAWRLCEP
jgi:dienelactone hydrolase